MKAILKFSFPLFAVVLLLQSCGDGDDEIRDISRIDPKANFLQISFTVPDAGGQTENFFYDAAGDTVTADVLVLNQGEYSVTVFFSDRENPDNVIELNPRITDNSEDFQVFYEFNAAADSVVTSFEYQDADADNRPLGINTQWTLSQPTAGGETVRIFLVEGLDKQAASLAGGVYNEGMGGEITLDAVLSLDVQ